MLRRRTEHVQVPAKACHSVPAEVVSSSTCLRSCYQSKLGLSVYDCVCLTFGEKHDIIGTSFERKWVRMKNQTFVLSFLARLRSGDGSADLSCVGVPIFT
jgi:hypothetical protein